LHGDGEAVIRTAIDKMTLFFNRLGMPTKLTDFNINADEAAERVRARFESRQVLLGELNQIDPDIVAEILRMSQ
jgi:alcohol dehydrogenase YqhD (iron-dependent ADH family)